MDFQTYTHWEEVKTRNGLCADEVISGLQKAIRRGMTEKACQYAYELYISGVIFLEKVWSRLMTISVEDIGFGNLSAAGQIHTLNEMRKNYAYNDVDQPMFFVHAIRILCASEKDRSSDYLKNIIIKKAAMGRLPEMMDVAIDKHTKRGKEMGRDSFQFFYEGAKVIPQAKVDNNYREEYEKVLKEFDDEKAERIFEYKSE